MRHNFFSAKKNLIIVLFLLLITFVIGGYFILLRTGRISSRADSSQSLLTLDPNVGSYNAGSNFDVNIRIDTAGSAIYGVQILSMHFDPKVLQVVDADTKKDGVQISKGNIAVFNIPLQNVVDNNAGTIKYSESSIDSSYSGSDVVAKINFKALLTATDTRINIDFDGSGTKTMLSDKLGVNLLKSVGPAAFNIVTATIAPTTAPTIDDSGGASKTATSQKPSETSSVETPVSVAPITTPKLQYSKVEMYKNDSMKPWVLWFLYAIIPAFLAGGAIYFYLKRKRLQKNNEAL